VANPLVLVACAKLTLLEEEEDIALSELGSEEDRLRRQRAHDVARTLESLHLEGSDVDLQIMAIAQRYVDGEISIDELMVAIEARSTDVL
jgi:Antitoxin VbhA